MLPKLKGIDPLKNIILILLLVIVAAVSALFFAQNDAVVQIKYFAGSIDWQMNWVLISTLLLGVALGAGSMSVSLFSTKIKLSNANRHLALHQKEIKNLRSLPIKDEI